MTLTEQIVTREKTRIEYMIEQYENRLALLPKGTLLKQVNKTEKEYYYLKYRESGKVVSKYIQAELWNIQGLDFGLHGV